jgi:hypothetical protein
MSESGKITMLVEMAVAALVSNEIYNFSELLEQPSLVSLKNSAESWMYELLEIFNKGDIPRYERFDLSKNVLNFFYFRIFWFRTNPPLNKRSES